MKEARHSIFGNALPLREHHFKHVKNSLFSELHFHRTQAYKYTLQAAGKYFITKHTIW